MCSCSSSSVARWPSLHDAFKIESGEKQVVSMSLRRALLRLSGGKELSALCDQALVSGANFATNVILARVLGIREYGIFALSWMAVLFVASLQWAFIVLPMMSVGPKQEEHDRPFYYGAVLIQEIAFAAMSVAGILIALRLSVLHFPQWNVQSLALPLSFAAFAYLLQDFVRRYFFSVSRSQFALICDAISYLTQIPIIVLFSHRPNFSSSVALWIIGATSLVSFLAGWVWFESIKFRTSALREVTVRHWKISRWLAPSAFMQWSSGNLFIVAAPVYYGAAAAAVLRAAQNIVAVAHVWFLGLDNVVPAEAARRMHSQGLDAAFNYIKQIMIRWGLITLAFVSIVSLRPNLWLKLVYGPKYAGYGHILQLYALLYLMTFFAGPLRAGLQALEYTAPIFWSYSAMTVFSLAFAAPFAQRLGLTGAMLGMIANMFLFQCVVGIALVLKVRQMRQQLLSPQLQHSPDR
jgi:O-antigen/teichoic acid export membrane protein